MVYKCPDCNTYFYGEFCPNCSRLSSTCIEMTEQQKREEQAAQAKAEQEATPTAAENSVAEAEQADGKKPEETPAEAKPESGSEVKCPKCGKVFSGKFCPECGCKVTELKKCPVCGAPHKAGDKFCAECGYSYEKKPSAAAATMAGIGTVIKNSCKNALTFCKRNSRRIIAVSVVVALILVIVVPVSVVFTSPVQPANVDRINIGDTQERVLSILGDPYDWEEGDRTFEYYSDNYLKIRKQLDEIANMDDIGSFGDLADALEKEEQLNQKLKNTEYKRTVVTFDDKGLVTQVVYDAKLVDRQSVSKELKSSNTVTEAIAYQENTVAYTLKYKDGSIFKSTATVTPVPEKIGDVTYPFYYDFQVNAPFSTSAGTKIDLKCKTVANPDIAYSTEVDGVSYTLGTNGTLTISGNGKITIIDDNLVIPKTESAKVIVIEEGITGLRSFGNYDNATSITIPNSVTEIKNGAFAGCDSLANITIKSGNAKYHSLGNCVIETQSKTLISGCKNSVIPDDGSVTSIGYDAFYNCSGLTSIIIPDSVTSIEGMAFYGCDSLENINVEQGNAVYHSVGNCIIETASKTLIIGCNNSVIPDDGSVTSIGSKAFSGCNGLTSITIPDGVTSIGNSAFYNCSGLTSITIPDGVTSIGDGTFSGCDSLTSITIPDSVTSIGDYAFSNSDLLTSINYEGTMAQWREIRLYLWWSWYSNVSTIICTDGTLDEDGNQI